MSDRSNSLSLGTFLVVAYFACLLLAFIVPDQSQHWLRFLPGYSWTPQGILLGLVEVFAYGIFAGVVFAPIYNAFNVQGSD